MIRFKYIFFLIAIALFSIPVLAQTKAHKKKQTTTTTKSSAKKSSSTKSSGKKSSGSSKSSGKSSSKKSSSGKSSGSKSSSKKGSSKKSSSKKHSSKKHSGGGESGENHFVKMARIPGSNVVSVFIGNRPFTNFIFLDSLEKPVLYPLNAANGMEITRGFPLNPKPGDPIDHPHHVGLWFNYENVNGLDFWNNSYAIPKDKKSQYGWIHTDKLLEMTNGSVGKLGYHANWTNQQGDILLEEVTHFEFSGTSSQRIVDRVTTLTAVKQVKFTDAKDGMLGLRLAHELQIPTTEDQKFTDDKGNTTVVKGGTDNIPTGNYITSAGKTGNDAWSTRGVWCKVYGKMGEDSVSVAIIDHPGNPNYPTFWHARGYGLFAANPLGEKVFTNGKSEKNLTLSPGQSVTFKYRVIITDGERTISGERLTEMAHSFAVR